ncbi:MAG: ABC transporter ATP-binding protein [Actinobacteria bacterium]|nr:MAG: ABC transporter ATP-binding protein [Actinomycetota bacterium]
MTNAIAVHDLRKSYDKVDAVCGIDFAVAEGEVVALLGPNGAGKTTTIEILEGFRQRTSGDVRVLGVDPADGGSELRQRLGIVLQSCGIDAYLTVAEVLEMHRDYYRRQRDVDEVIELVGLTEKRDTRVKLLSGGQQRRLDVALGLVGDPDLLFLDEPTTGFDPSARRHAWEIVRNLRSLGKTVLLTTHYMDEAQNLADRVIVIAGGKIVAEGPPETIGGRADAPSIIEFSIPDHLAATMPLAATRHDGSFVIESTDTTRDLHRLTTWALEAGVVLDGLTVTKPSLEDTYLRLIGEDREHA